MPGLIGKCAISMISVPFCGTRRAFALDWRRQAPTQAENTNNRRSRKASRGNLEQNSNPGPMRSADLGRGNGASHPLDHRWYTLCILESIMRLLLTNVRKLLREWQEQYRESRDGYPALTVLDRLRLL